MRITILFCHILFLRLFWLVYPNIRIVQSQRSAIFIRSDGSVEGTNKISVDGNYYRLTGNITIDSYEDIGIEVKLNIPVNGK